MKSLILIRHAKSDWGTHLSDIDRPIKPSGAADARNVATELSKSLPSSYVVWSSVAKRAYETCTKFAREWSYSPDKIVWIDKLYTFDGDVLESIIRTASDADETLVLFGHNEGITEFVNKFGNIYLDNVPTAAAVMIKFDTSSWRTITKGQTILTLFPRDLRS